jgi:NAD(P)-dependent dehydrogenase (short-subunit alcohol dehydrogenase family)
MLRQNLNCFLLRVLHQLKASRKYTRECGKPGAMDTPMLWDNPNVKDGLEKIEMTDVGKPEDIADLTVYLGSDKAAFVRGAAIRVDSGRLDRLQQ